MGAVTRSSLCAQPGESRGVQPVGAEIIHIHTTENVVTSKTIDIKTPDGSYIVIDDISHLEIEASKSDADHLASDMRSSHPLEDRCQTAAPHRK
jgi:hypothetical protein